MFALMFIKNADIVSFHVLCLVLVSELTVRINWEVFSPLLFFGSICYILLFTYAEVKQANGTKYLSKIQECF